jgi:hypothetical protein
MNPFTAYHVVTDTPMHPGQIIHFDEHHHNGVYQRVMDKLEIIRDIYAHPDHYDADTLEHHSAVALRELALEEVRKKHYSAYPSRLSCLYVSNDIEDAKKWGELFVTWGRPTYHVVKLNIYGNRFIADANNCFSPSLNRETNLSMAQRYWKNEPNLSGELPITEILVDGTIQIVDIIEQINKNV